MFYCIFVSLAAGCFHSFSLPSFFLSVIWRECEELEKKRETERELRDPTAIKALPFCAIYLFFFFSFLFNSFRLYFHFFSRFLLRLICSMQSTIVMTQRVSAPSQIVFVRRAFVVFRLYVCVPFISFFARPFILFVDWSRPLPLPLDFIRNVTRTWLRRVCVFVSMTRPFPLLFHLFIFSLWGTPLRCIRISSFFFIQMIAFLRLKVVV